MEVFMSDVMFEHERVGVIPGYTDEIAEEKGPAWISDPAELLAILGEVCTEHLLPEERRGSFNGHRINQQSHHWPVGNLTHDAVDADIWRSMVTAAIKGCMDTIRLSQNNTTWQLLEFETARRKVNGVDLIGVRLAFVDVLGKKDLVYRNGRVVDGATPDLGAIGAFIERDAEFKTLLLQLLAQSSGAPALPPQAAPTTTPEVFAGPAEEVDPAEERPTAKQVPNPGGPTTTVVDLPKRK
jgi:hypothetical protein